MQSRVADRVPRRLSGTAEQEVRKMEIDLAIRGQEVSGPWISESRGEGIWQGRKEACKTCRQKAPRLPTLASQKSSILEPAQLETLAEHLRRPSNLGELMT